MRRITLDIDSIAKDHINRYFEKNNEEGAKYILRKIAEIMTELNSLSVITDKKLRIKLINLLLLNANLSVSNDSALPSEIKSYFINLIHTIRKVSIRRLDVTYIIFDKETLKTASDKVYNTIKSAEKKRKALEKSHKKIYSIDTLENYKSQKVEKARKRYELENRETS